MHDCFGGCCVVHAPACLTAGAIQLTRDCIGGNAKTLVLVHMSPCERDEDESLRTLKFVHKLKVSRGVGRRGARWRRRGAGDCSASIRVDNLVCPLLRCMTT